MLVEIVGYGNCDFGGYGDFGDCDGGCGGDDCDDCDGDDDVELQYEKEEDEEVVLDLYVRVTA